MNKGYTEEEAETVRELFLHYAQFNFRQIAINRITWDTGIDVETVEQILSETT